MVIVGIILLIASIILFFVRLAQLKKLGCIQSARLSTAQDIQEISNAVAQDIGAGSWQDYVKVYGKIVCDAPIQSQVKGVDCVYYTTKVTREYEEVVTKKDDQGNKKKETERHSEIVSKEERSTPFWIVDSSGKIEVHPDEAKIETVEILSEFRRESQHGSKISFGGFSLSFGSQGNGRGRTLGYKYEESILPISREALVIGMATDVTSTTTIRKPSDHKQQFIISLKTEGELTKSVTRTAKQMFYAMLGCLGTGALLFGVGLASSV